MKGCSVQECSRVHFARSYCRLHYERYRRNGAPIVRQIPKEMSAADRLAVLSRREGECLVFTGHTNQSGYGQMSIKGEQCAPHRVAYELAYGPIPEGMVIRHSCDNPPCIEPSHLGIGTAQDNADDKVKRGRSLVGSRNGCAKLTEAQVIEIRDAIAAGKTHVYLAKQFGVGKTTIGRIALRESWKHVRKEG